MKEKRHSAIGTRDVVFVSTPGAESVPPGIKEEVTRAVAADPAHVVSLLGWSPPEEADQRARKWMVWEREQAVTIPMKCAGILAWKAFWRDTPKGSLEEALVRVYAEMSWQAPDR